ncbi:MAG: hypothetical protein K2X65_02255 [Burkholderiaceae bacterium]|jgi:hypothetical protein|nr:hypothetical protein [Burkholderiaceae bacterium]
MAIDHWQTTIYLIAISACQTTVSNTKHTEIAYLQALVAIKIKHPPPPDSNH